MSNMPVRLLAACALVLGSGCCCLDRVYRCDDGCIPAGFSGRFTHDDCPGCADCCDYTLTARLKHAVTCGSGCSEVYWGDWISDPPRAYGDPCDDCGDWVGPQPCRCSCLQTGLHWLWGHRFGEPCGSCGGIGCSTCGEGEPFHVPVWDDMPGPPPQSVEPTPAPQPTMRRSLPRPYSYLPQITRRPMTRPVR